MKRHPHILQCAYPIIIALLLVSSTLLRAAEPIGLRGYGKVAAEFTDNRAVFQCESAEKADILLGKMLADLFWDAGDKTTQRQLNVDGVNVTIHAWSPYGVISVGRVGSKVIAVGAADDAALTKQLHQHADFLKGSPVFVPAKPYPRYLDHYDLRAFKAYTGAMKSGSDLGLDSHWKFLKKFGMGGIAFQSLSVTHQYPAPGVINFVQSDYEMRTADEQGGVAAIGLGGGGEVPLWIYNLMPDGMMRQSLTTLLGGWNGTGYVGAHFESWWLPPERRESGALLFTRQAMERYRDNPALSAWHLYTGSPGAEFGFHGLTGEFWDYSPVGAAAFRTWLRDVRKYDLAALGQRWHGDARHFTSWEQVELPDANGFFGGMDESSMRLAEGWQWASARDGVAEPPPADAPAWIPVAMPPEQQQVLLPWGEAFYRIEFDGKDWAKRPQAWLACSALVRSTNPTVVWLNGVQLAAVPTEGSQPISVPLTGKLNPGRNTLVVRVPRSGKETAGADQVRGGKIFGPVYLTAKEPQNYPYLGAQINARAVDLRLWQAAGLANSHRAMLNLALAIDPDHPFNLSGSVVQWPALMTELAEDFGATVQHTGRSSWYHPWWAGIGLVGGFYGTSEEAGTDHAKGLTRELGWMLLDGDSNHNLYRDIEDYQLEEQKTGWFTKNQRAIQCFGKYLRTMPQIAILHPGRSLVQNMDWMTWDLGLGDLQAVHFDNAYATETELVKGMTDACPVLIDSGTEIMDDDVLAALQRYVERGGTFVALHHTGRHSNTTQNAQPLARLTGLMTVPHPTGKLHIAKGTPVLAAWAGREFTSGGVSLTPAPREFSDVMVPGEAPVAVANWDDGAMAVAIRRIGKGRVIQLGATFWHESGKSTFLERLLSDLGVTRNADASLPAVWTRKATTKNGLQDWLLTFNNSNASCTADVRLAVNKKPAQVWDLLTRQPVEAAYADGFITIPKVRYAPNEIHLFATKRADLADGLAFWWGEKTRFWKTPPALSSPEVVAAKQWLTQPAALPGANSDTISFPRWRFLADRDRTSEGAVPAWLQAGYDDSSWNQIDNGPWNLLDPKLADWHGTGIYRSTFTVPPAWKDRRVILNLFDWDRPIVYDQGEFFINGVKVADYKSRGWSHAYAYDVTSLLQEGANVLAVRVQGGKEFSGICGNVWLEPELKFAAEMNLAGPWRIVNGDYKSEESTTLPGQPVGRYLKRDVDLPADWTGKTVFLHLETQTQWFSSVLVNGHPINTNSSLHPFSPRCEVNLTPYLVPGRNRIELWPYGTIPSVFAKETQEKTSMPITAIRLGVLKSKSAGD